MIGVARRLGRLFDAQSGRSVILALDHGAGDGMIPGLARVPELVARLHEHRVQAVVFNKGLARSLGARLSVAVNVAVNLSAGTKHGQPDYNKSLVCTVGEALRAGADAVSVHVNMGNELEDRMLADMGLATGEAHQAGLPVLAVICPRGERIVNELDPTLIAHCIRLGGELGADMVGVPYSGDAESFAQAAQAGPAPVLVTGGPGQPDFGSFLAMVGSALAAGAMGVVVGRNIFQHPEPLTALARVCALVHGE